MRALYVIGIGAGNPQHLTLEAVEALKNVDVVLAFQKESKEELLALRRQILERYAPLASLVAMPDPPRERRPKEYVGEVKKWLAARAELLEQTIAEHVAEDATAAVLVWGDPSLYDSTLRILDDLQLQTDVHVIPGITAIQALTAAHKIPLNLIGSDITITTARKFAEQPSAENSVVMLDGGAAWMVQKDPHAYIWWGAYLGMGKEVLRSGYISDIGAEIVELKEKLRNQYGWIMDIYLVRSVTNEAAG